LGFTPSVPVKVRYMRTPSQIVRGVTETGEENQRTPRATPVQHFELDTLVYGDDFSVVR
jgi:hypothetical protein